MNAPTTICLLLLLSATARAEDWPNYRGPNFDGNSTEALPSNLPDEPRILWRAKVGTGFSTVSVSRGRVLTMGNTDEVDTVYCLDATSGKILWKHSYPCALDPRFYEGGPGATPTIQGDAVYTLSKKGHAHRLDFETGKVIWSRDLTSDHKMELPEWSFASSPYLHDDLVVLNCGGAGIALDQATGKTRWKSNTQPSGYATAVPFERAGATELLLFVAEEVLAVDPGNGQSSLASLFQVQPQCQRRRPRRRRQTAS